MYIVLEKFNRLGGVIDVVIDEPERGLTKFFETEEEAQKFADEECQDGQVVDIED